VPRKPKVVTYEQAKAKLAKAVKFLRDVAGDADRADDFAAMSVQEYAQHKGLTLQNPHKSRIKRTTRMATDTITKRELEDTLDEVADLLDEALDPELTREAAISKIKEAVEIISGGEDEGDGDDEGDELGED